MVASVKNRLRAALREDGAFSDVTTRRLPGAQKTRVVADLYAKANGVFCGAFLLKPLFSLLDPSVKVRLKKRDGRFIRRGEILATLQAKAPAIFAGERLFLNLACHLSGIATLTRSFVEAVKPYPVSILDTRKTTPLWRDLERLAVRCGGGQNHRFSLEDAILAKDNHLAYLRARGLSPSSVYRKTNDRNIKFLEIEAKTNEEVWDAIKAGAEIIMLDNMSPAQVRVSSEFIKAARRSLGGDRPLIEVSGGITVKQAKRLASLGVDRISVGALTHSAPALDLSLEVR